MVIAETAFVRAVTRYATVDNTNYLKDDNYYSPDCMLSSDAGLKCSGGSSATVRSPVYPAKTKIRSVIDGYTTTTTPLFALYLHR